jgi:carbon-monoxide dehydrogenase medium subunit
MLRKLKEFEYFEASSFSEAVSLLGQYGKEAWLVAGGTDLLVWMKEGARRPKAVINIKSIPEADQITFDEKNGLKIGCLVKISEIQSSTVIQDRFSPLAQAAKELGSAQVRNLATIGGNLCTAAPSAETAPPLLTLNAKVRLHGAKGQREVSLEEFFMGPGSTVLDGEVLTEILIPSPASGTRGVYKRISRRNAVDMAIVGVAAVGVMSEDSKEWQDIKIALGAVAPTPMRAVKAENILKGHKIESASIEEAAQLASEEARPISDVRGSAWYRKEMVKVLVRRSLEEISNT